MDFNGMIQSIATHATPVNVILFVLLVVSEVIGSTDSIKASSIYGVIKALLLTAKDQVFPQKPAA